MEPDDEAREPVLSEWWVEALLKGEVEAQDEGAARHQEMADPEQAEESLQETDRDPAGR